MRQSCVAILRLIRLFLAVNERERKLAASLGRRYPPTRRRTKNSKPRLAKIHVEGSGTADMVIEAVAPGCSTMLPLVPFEVATPPF